MVRVKVGVFSDDDEIVFDGYVRQSDKHGIKATWAAIAMSGIANYIYTVTAQYAGMCIWRLI
jgi:hypothetical protein